MYYLCNPQLYARPRSPVLAHLEGRPDQPPAGVSGQAARVQAHVCEASPGHSLLLLLPFCRLGLQGLRGAPGQNGRREGVSGLQAYIGLPAGCGTNRQVGARLLASTSRPPQRVQPHPAQIAWHGTGTPQHSAAQHSSAWHRTAQRSTAQRNKLACSARVRMRLGVFWWPCRLLPWLERSSSCLACAFASSLSNRAR